MAKTRARLLSLARFGLLFALLALGVALVLSAWASRRDGERLSVLLDRGQSESFFHAIPRIHERNRGAATHADLQQLLDEFQSEGLRYLVEYDAHGSLLAEAGEHLGVNRPRPSGKPGQPVVIADRVRITFYPPRGPNGPRANFELPDLVMEFEPVVANQLRSRATKSFVFSLGAAASLFAVTLLLWLALAREERNRRRHERERHLASLGEMSAVLAHEIRNPLASLKGHAQLLGEQLDADSPLQKKVVRIVNEAKRLEELTSTLLDLVRSSAIARQPTAPGQLLNDVAQALAADRIIVDVAAAPPSWSLDPLRMEQVLRNVLENALQASPVNSVVEAGVTVERDKLVLRVRDHGPGLAAGVEQLIFEPFHTTRTHGTGLGLAVARRIVEQHGGQIRAENHADGGALFTLTIPA